MFQEPFFFHTATTLVAGPSVSTYGTPLTFTATVTPGTATGRVGFYWGIYPWGTASVVAGQAVFTPTTVFPPGYIGFSAWYQGDVNNLSSTSSSVVLTVNPAPLAITAGSATLTQGGIVPSITPSYSGFVNGEAPNSRAAPR